MRLLDRSGHTSHSVNRIVLPGEIHDLFREQLFDDLKGLFKAADACASALEWNAHLVVIGRSDARTKPKFKASFGQQIQSSGFLSQHSRMPVIITEYKSANPQRRCCLGCHREGCEGCNAHAYAVHDYQVPVPDFLHPATSPNPS